ncbi:MAG: Gfo/Idh/MocA family oxidoreductase [Anaerolineae bacterium]|nr:Gfo/Idh/MocA family oxidoreductase [Anaerolineae bacterium]
MAKKRYVQVGLGGRARMYYDAVMGTYGEHAELLGVCDVNAGRVEYLVDLARERGFEIKGYQAEQFDQMVAECKPDTVIVTTKDCYHDAYICRAMELGCDVITEKPMTTDEVKCQRIIDTQRATGKTCTVTFNYRYSPPRTQVKALLMAGVIGDVLSVDFHWMLDIRHGADYFRRWHRNKENSGGLMVHKATHHFDMVNWWLSTVPESVFAQGHRRFYTPHTATRYGLDNRAERCLECPETACRFRLDLRMHERMRRLYLENEQYDGYFRDRCVFSDLIDIEDSMNLVVNYQNGVKMSYSLNAFMPWEGYTISFNGTRGRMEHKTVESSYINADGSVPGQTIQRGTFTEIFPHFGPSYRVDLWTAAGGHGGGDSRILVDLLSETPPADLYMRAADQRAGAYSILTGIAANHSMATGRLIRIDDLVQNIGMPDYTAMPSSDERLLFDEGVAVDVSQPEWL